jgi:hypothetical protein
VQGLCQRREKNREGSAEVRGRKILKRSQKLCAIARRLTGASVFCARSPPPARQYKRFKAPMVAAATAPSSAVLFLFTVSFLCFMSGAALRRWPERVQAYMERVDGSLWFVSATTHRALIGATGVALTALSLLAVVAARLIA